MNQAKQAVNPYLPSYEYVPDGEPHVFNGRVYVYGSHDRFGGNDFCLNDYVCWSARADDLANWRYEGTSYRSVQDPLCAEGSTAMRLFAPDVQRGGDGRYYLFYALEFCGRISVAVSESPVGPFQFYDHVHYPDGTLLGAKEGDAFQYDPGIFVDDNGRVYLVSGFCPIPGINPKFAAMHLFTKGCQLIELADDMCTVREAPQIVLPQQADAEETEFAEHPFFEAPSLRKANGRYYLIYSSTQNHELCYAVADKPQGVYHYGGTIVSNGDIGLDGRTVPCNYTGTNHGSIVEINGQWYVFYHRQTNRTPYSRQGWGEKITLACKPPTVPAPTAPKPPSAKSTPTSPRMALTAIFLPSSMLPTCAMAPTRATAAFCCIPVPILQLPIAALAMVRWKLPQRKVVPRPLYSR